MSTPEQIQNEERADAAKQADAGPEPVREVLDVQAAVRQLRMLTCGLGAGVLVVSLGLSAFVYKQNRNLSAAINMRQRQLNQLQATQQPLIFALNELGKYSVGKPEYMAIFTRHGIEIKSAPETGTAVPKPAAP